MNRPSRRYCGIDWASDHHDIAVIDQAGTVLARKRVDNNAQGWKAFLDCLAEAGDTATAPIPVAIETDRGLWVAALRSTDRTVYAINPLAASHYRARRSVAGAKSDAADAVILAEILRTDASAHRPLGNDSDLAGAIRVLARAQQDAVWERVRLGQQITALLKDFYPAALAAIEALPQGGMARADARALLGAALTPVKGARLSRAKLRSLLKRSGRVRFIDRDVEALYTILRSAQLHQPALIEHAQGLQLSALLHQFEAACTAAEDLAEIGDDRTRFADPRALKAYAGSAPITRASGKKQVVTHRHVKNRRLNSVGPIWTLAALRGSPGADAHYRKRRNRGDWHRSAQRHLFNRLLGCLWYCLQTHTLYNEDHAFPLPLAGKA